MDLGEVQCVAREILRAAGSDELEVVSARKLAEALLGRGAIVRCSGGLGAPATMATVNGETRIFLRCRLPLEAERFLVMHELAEWWLARVGYQGEDIEQAANAIAAALVAPREAFRMAARTVGSANLRKLARAFLTTESVVALRIGEVLHEPVALVTPHSVHARGDIEWPDAETLRRVARTGRPGLRRTRLHDDPRRVVVRVA